MTFILTFGLTFLLVMAALLIFWKFGAPVYRLERHNIIQLLELVISGRATDSDWTVFEASPIHRDPLLRAIQERCLSIACEDHGGSHGFLFSPRGIEKLSEILRELRQQELLEKNSEQR